MKRYSPCELLGAGCSTRFGSFELADLTWVEKTPQFLHQDRFSHQTRFYRESVKLQAMALAFKHCFDSPLLAVIFSILKSFGSTTASSRSPEAR